MEIETLSNGVRVATEHIPFLRSVAFGVFVRNGSQNETTAQNGISHFIEHMLFKGTKSRTAKDIADTIDEIGGQFNAYTTKEYTAYYVRVLDSHLDIAMDILSDMFFRSEFLETEIEKERQVIVEEISMVEDTPEELVVDLLQELMFEKHPLSQPILGTEESIKGFSKQTFLDYFANNYRPENTVVVVAGNFDKKTLTKRVESHFSSFSSGALLQPKTNKIVYKKGIVKREKDVEQVHLCVGFPSICVGSKDAYAMMVLNTCFGGGMSSRLFQNIREKHGLAYSVYSFSSSFLEAGLFGIYAALAPEQASAVWRLMVNEIKGLFENPISENVLHKTKEQLKSNYMLSLESSSSRMGSLGRSVLLLNRMLTFDEIIAKIDAVSLTQVEQLAKQVFCFDQMGLSVVGNLGKNNWEGMIVDV